MTQRTIIIIIVTQSMKSTKSCAIYRLYRAQRLYVQLLPKSMLLAILIGNGIRLQSTLLLFVMKKVFSCHILQDTKVVCPFRKNSPSTKVVCLFLENPPSTRLYAHCPYIRESADLLLFVT